MADKITCPMCGNQNEEKNLYIGKSESYLGIGNRICWCKDCISKIYSNYYNTHKDNKKAIYMMCRKLDVPFKISAFEGALKDSKIKQQDIYKSYFTKLNSLGKSNNYGICFDDSDEIEFSENILSIDDSYEDFEVTRDMIIFWGSGFEKADYVFLETELASWKSTHKCDNRAELTLLKEICLKILEIRVLRESKMPVSKEQKDLQDLMKTASVDPAKANVASAGKAVDAFGVWVKDIETKKPAEWWEDQEKYKDMDGFIPYIKKYIVRPIKNFFTGSKDFDIDAIDATVDDSEVGEENG